MPAVILSAFAAPVLGACWGAGKAAQDRPPRGAPELQPGDKI